MADNGTVYYLYCLTPCGSGISVSATGVDGRHAVLLRPFGGLGAVLSEVERGDFCGDAAEARLGDLAWLGPRVRRHEAVIEEIMSQAPVLPARFATLFTSIDSLDRFVLEHLGPIAGFFVQLGDRQEWAVKGLLNRTEALAKPASADRLIAKERTPFPTAGARYLQQQRIKSQWEKDLNHRLKDFCRQAAAALAAQTGGFRERGVIASASAEKDAEVVLNWAFLLSPSDLDNFRRRLERLNRDDAFPGLTMALTGPWPPYSFLPDLPAGEKA